MTAEKSGTWALLALRLVVGYGFMAHGFAKVSRGPEAFAVIPSTLPATAALRSCRAFPTARCESCAAAERLARARPGCFPRRGRGARSLATSQHRPDLRCRRGRR